MKNIETLCQVPADLSKIETMAQQKLKITFITQENIPVELSAKIMANHEKFGYMCFLPGERQIDALDVAMLEPIKYEEDEKSPSQRLRGALYVLWSQKKPTETFESYYRQTLEKFTNSVKEKLV